MRQQTSIYIPKPCHEDWNKMTPTQQGKFCASCNKQIVDFSLMTDNQLLNFLSHQPGKLCGRFDAEQLQRPLVETRIEKKKSWWMALMMPLLFLFERSSGQTTCISKSDTTVETEISKRIVLGKIAANSLMQIKGRVIDENNEPVQFATIRQHGTIKAVVTDSLGDFSISLNPNDKKVLLNISCIGFQSLDKEFNVEIQKELIINLKTEIETLGEVVVVGYYSMRTAGLMATVTKITTLNKVDTSFKKAFGISNIYPNPATRGNAIHIKIKNAANYQMQLLNTQSALIQSQEINTYSAKSVVTVRLPTNIPAGMYYLRLINEDTKKSFTEKLIIQ